MKPRLYLETTIPSYLLTWNCKHINNHHIRSLIQWACAVFDLVCPDICTPAELMKP